MAEINKDIGLDAALAGIGTGATSSDDEKTRNGSESGKSGAAKTKEIELVR